MEQVIVEQLVPDVKKILPGAKLVLGGPEAEYNAESWLSRFTMTDAVIAGGGENAIRTLAGFNFDFGRIPSDSVETCSSGLIVRMQNRPFHEIPFPYIDRDFDDLKDRYLYYESSRGCPFTCTYCISSRSDKKPEFKSTDIVIDELSMVLSRHPMIVKFVDRSFNSNPERARTIWRHLIGRAGDTRFHFEIHPEYFHEKDFALLESAPAGLFQFEIGIQTVNKRALEEIGRMADWDKVKPNIERLIRAGNIRIHLDLIAGLPYEAINDISRSFDEIISLRPDHFQLGFLKILSGTEMKEKSDGYGMEYLECPPYRILKNKWLSPDDLMLLRKIEQLVETVYNGSLHDQLPGIKNRGAFEVYKKCVRYCDAAGFDLSTKNKTKILKMIQGFSKEFV